MKVPEQYRILKGVFKSSKEEGCNGLFRINSLKFNRVLNVIASDGAGWEHVSVSIYDRTPTWEEMCFVKGLFWESSECVLQYHPPESEYVNNHEFCLHLWKPKDTNIPMPPSILVGLK